MNGIKLFLDTNAIIALLNGNALLSDLTAKASWLETSSVCVIEFLSFSSLTPTNEHYFHIFLQRIAVTGLSSDPNELANIALFRKQHRLKLPDAIIAAQAAASGATLVSNDKHFNNIPGLNLLQF